MREYLETHVKSKRKFKSDKERKSYVTDTLKLKLQKDPTRNNILCIPVAQDTLMKAGLKMSTERIKDEAHQCKDEAKESFKRASEGVKGSTNTKARRSGLKGGTNDKFEMC